MADKLSIREGLIEVVTAERFQAKPRSGSNTHVVVMEKTGGTLRHYTTLRADQDKLSIGEQLWGNFVCYVVHLNSREWLIEQDFALKDHITNLHVRTNITYHAVDGEKVAIGVDDALESLREEVVTTFKREIGRSTLEEITEERLETRLYQLGVNLQNSLGIAFEKNRVQVDLPAEELNRRRTARDQQRAQQAEDAKRQREWQIQDQDRRRAQQLEKGDIEHIDDLIQRLGLEGLPADFRLRLHAMPRKEAYNQIIMLIEGQRNFTRELMSQRMQQEYDLLKKMIDEKILEQMDLADFGKTLLDRYSRSLAAEEMLGMPPSFMFGTPPRPIIGENKEASKQLPDQSAGKENSSDKTTTDQPPSSTQQDAADKD